MLKQIRWLSGLQLCNLFGWNEFRYTKDRKKKWMYVAMAALWIILVSVLAVFIGKLSALLIRYGLERVVPVYFYTIVSLVILFFTFLKAGSVLFSMNSFEILISLPLSKAAIVISRFLTMYVTGLLMGMAVLLPGIAVYGYLVRPGLWFYLAGMIGILFLPLLPLTLASIAGALITAVSARIRHKSLAEAALMILLSLAVLVGSTLLPESGEEIGAEMLLNLSDMMIRQIGKFYPSALWYGSAVSGNGLSLLWLIAVPALIFAGFAAVLQNCFLDICVALNTTSAKHDYQMKSQNSHSLLRALLGRELKRYFASGIYVANTIMGYVLMIVIAVMMLAAGTEKIRMLLGIPWITESLFPFLLALPAVITSMTSCSISMEGKQFWIIQTLPVREKEIYDSKLLANLVIAAPFWLISTVILCAAVQPSFAEGVWIFVIPACYIVFLTVAGLAVNLAVPVLNWDNEVKVVKQSASTAIVMVVGMVSVLLPTAGVLWLTKVPAYVILGVTAAVLIVLTAGLYRIGLRKKLIETAA